jgi:hypothetical protein
MDNAKWGDIGMSIYNRFWAIGYRITSSLDEGYIDMVFPESKSIKSFVSNEPHDFINSLSIEFFCADEEEEEQRIGTLYANHIKVSEAIERDDVEIFDIFDCHDQDTYDVYCALFDEDSGWFKSELGIGIYQDIFFIYDLDIEDKSNFVEVGEIIIRSIPNILRHNRDIWVGATVYNTKDTYKRRVLLDNGYKPIAGTGYLYMNPEAEGYYDIDEIFEDGYEELADDN